MADYFLERSPTYVAEAKRKKNFRRRQVVCRHLKNNYKAGRGKEEEIFKLVEGELAAEKIKITKSQFKSDKNILRGSYVWLREEDQAKKEQLVKKWPSVRGVIGWLKKDNINSWEDIIKLGQASIPQAVAVDQLVDPFSLIKQKLAGSQAGEKVTEIFYQLSDCLGPLMEENDRLKEELHHVDELHKDEQTYLEFVEEENELLEKRLQEARESLRHARSATLEEISAEHPEIPELFSLAQKLKQTPPRWQVEFEYLIAQLPKTFAWQSDSDTIGYGPHFLRPLTRLQQHEQEQVIKQIKTLSAEGPGYHSLDTRKNEGRLPFSPLGSMSSRGSDVWRFSWKKNGGVVIHALYRKSDTRLWQSEA